MNRLPTVIVTFLALTATSHLNAQPITIDTFSTNSPTTSFGPGGGGGTLTRFDDGAGILQTERNIRLSTGSLGAAETVSVDVGTTLAGALAFARSAGVTNTTVEVWWDGNNDTSVFNPTGLGGINLTAGGQDRFVINVVGSSDTVKQMRLVVWTDGSNLSEQNFTLPAAGGTVTLLYSGFTIAGGTGANFTNVGAIFLRTVDPSGAWSAQITNISTQPVELMSFSAE